MKNPNTFSSRFWFGMKVAIALIAGMPFVAVGILLCMTIFGIAPGLACLALSGYPLKHVVAHRIKQKLDWDWRDKPLYDRNEAQRPWEVNDAEQNG